MTPRERVQAAFELKDADKVPLHHIGFSAEIASALLGREAFVGGGIQRWREATALWQGEDAHQEFLERSFHDAMDISLYVGNDIVRAEYWRMPQKPTRRLDENTFLYEAGPEEDWLVLQYDPPSEQCRRLPYKQAAEPTFEELERGVVAAEASLADYEPQEAGYAAVLRARELLGEERVIRAPAGGVGLPHEGIWFEALIERPDLVARKLDIDVARAAKCIPFLAERGFRYIFGGGDFASNEGPMYSPKHFRALLLPRICRIAEICHRHGCRYLFASDGNLWPVADDLFGASGVDGFYEIDRRGGMDLARLRARFPRLVLVGNISSHTVHLSTKDEIVAETVSCLEEAQRSKGIIVGASNYFVPGTPVENVEAMLKVIREKR